MWRSLCLVVFFTHLVLQAGSTCSSEDQPPRDRAGIMLNGKRAKAAMVAKSTFKSRVQLLTEPAQFDGSVRDARRLYSVIGANIGSDKAIPNWQENVLQASDFEKLDGYSLSSRPREERQQVQGKASTEQRVQISSDSGESFRVTILYTDSPQRARVCLLAWFSSTSMGVGQHIWNLTPIEDGAGEVCLVPVLFTFRQDSKSLDNPRKADVLDWKAVFFRRGIAVQVINMGRADDMSEQKRQRSAMDLAMRIDAMLVRKIQAGTDES